MLNLCWMWWRCCDCGLFHGVFPQHRSAQIIWSDPVEWNGVREGQPLVLCFTLCCNVIRAHWERHGLDCNPLASLCLFLIFFCTIPLSLFDSCGSPSLSQTQSIYFNLPVSLSTSPSLGYWDSAAHLLHSAPLSSTHLPTGFINIVNQSLVRYMFQVFD